MKHKPYDKLRGALYEKKITYSDLSNLLGISTVSVGNKINGKSDFYVREVKKICDTYELEKEIFLI